MSDTSPLPLSSRVHEITTDLETLQSDLRLRNEWSLTQKVQHTIGRVKAIEEEVKAMETEPCNG